MRLRVVDERTLEIEGERVFDLRDYGLEPPRILMLKVYPEVRVRAQVIAERGAVAMCLGIPGEVVDVRDDGGLRIGTVRFAGITRDVCLDYVPDAAVGEYVLVHVGFAISKIDARGSGAHVPGPGGARPDGRADRRPGARGAPAMKYLDEYRDGDIADGLRRAIADTVTRPWVLMEVCGGQTHSIVRYGIDRMIPPTIELVHGPGCPVCVTPLEMIDRAHAIARRPDVIFTSFGDMLRVPGSHGDLLTLKGRGADVRVVYSPLDALRIARDNPQRQVVFFGIGFETTAPANAMAVFQARRQGLGELLDARVARARAAGDGGDPRVARQPRAGVPRSRPRVRRHGLRASTRRSARATACRS